MTGNSEERSPDQKLSFTDAAERVLDQFAGQEPMHYKTLTDKALELGLIVTTGKTPEATMYVQVLSEIKRKAKRGNQSRFIKEGRGLFGLTKWRGNGLPFQIAEHNAKVRAELLTRVRAMLPADFEALVAELLAAIGFEDVTVTSVSKDGGIDVRGTLVVGEVIRTKMAVQVKRWAANVQAPVVQQVRGSLGTHEQGLIVTTSNFSPGARTEAARADAVPVSLMNGVQLAEVLAENGIGVIRSTHELMELLDEGSLAAN